MCEQEIGFPVFQKAQYFITKDILLISYFFLLLNFLCYKSVTYAIRT